MTAPATGQGMPMPLDIFIVDDHELVRLGLRTLLGHEPGLRIAGEATTAAEAVEGALRLRPAVVLMDVRLPDRSGVEACRDIRSGCEQIKVLMLTSHADEQAVFDSIMAGAAGYLLKEIAGGELVRAIRAVAEGASLLDPAVTAKVLGMMARLAAGPVAMRGGRPLSAQEERVLALVAAGKTNKEIGRELGLSDKTVKNYVSHVFEKLNLSRRAEAAAYFVRWQRD